MADDDKNIEGLENEELSEGYAGHEYESLANALGEEVSDETFDELLKAFEDLESQVPIPSGELGPGSLGPGDASELDEMEGMSESKLDAMIRELMEQEKEEEPWVPRSDLDDIMEPETEIYEGELAGQEIDLSVLYSDDKTKFSFKNSRKWIAEQYKTGDRATKILMLSIAAMFVVTVASIGVFIGVLFNVAGQQNNGAFAITPPAYAFNNASHSFVNLTAIMGDEPITLHRLLLDEVATVFYFRGILDPARYIFRMEDFNGRIYSKEIIYATNHLRDYLLEQTTVTFERLDPLAAGFTLSITDLLTGITTSMDLTYSEDAFALGRYITEPIEIETGVPGISILIDHGTFSAFGSILNFSVKSDLDGADLVFATGDAIAPITIRHAGFIVPAVDNNISISHFPQTGVTLGSIDFSPLRSLMGRVDVSFGHAYKRYNIGQRLSAQNMFTAGENRAITLDLNDHIINISGMMLQGNYFVMPMHGLQRYFVEEDGIIIEEGFTRMPTTIDVNLLGIADDGRSIRLPGRVIYDGRGTDVLFDVRENEDILNIPRSRLYIEVQNISVRLPQLSTSINLSDLGFTPLEHHNAIAEDIEAHFIANSGRLLTQFSARENIEYRAQVRQMRFEGNRVYARLVERLAFTNEEGLQEIKLNHRVVAEVSASGATVIQSVIIN